MSEYAERTEEIRSAMLLSLEKVPLADHPQLLRRLRYAQDIAELWYARSDLMQAVSAVHGESYARRDLAGITALFDGLEPGGGTSRPSPLSMH